MLWYIYVADDASVDAAIDVITMPQSLDASDDDSERSVQLLIQN
jgi:hypothetical protein